MTGPIGPTGPPSFALLPLNNIWTGTNTFENPVTTNNNFISNYDSSFNGLVAINNDNLLVSKYIGVNKTNPRYNIDVNGTIGCGVVFQFDAETGEDQMGTININQLVLDKQLIANLGITIPFGQQFINNSDTTLNGNLYVNSLGKSIILGDLSINGVLDVGDLSNYYNKTYINNTYATLVSPSLTGTPLAPTATSGTNTTQIATTAFVRNEVSNLVASAPAALDTLNELAVALGSDLSFSTTITNRLGAMDNSINIVYTKTTIDSSINIGYYNKTVIDTSVNTNFFNKTQIQNTYAPLSTPSFTGKITSAGDLSLNSKLSVLNDVSMNGNLYVASKSRFVSDVSLNGVVQVGSVFGGSKTAVANDLNVYGLNIGAGSFTSDSDCTLSGNLSISASKAVYGGSTTVGTSKLSVYGLNTGVGGITIPATGAISGGGIAVGTSALSVYGLSTGVGGVTIPSTGAISGGGIAVGTSKLSVYGLNFGAGDITTTTGYIGIGSSAPDYPLKVMSAVGNINISNAGRLTSSGATGSVTTTNASISIKAGASIWTDVNVFASSDKRIKTDINDINGNSALDKFRQIKPVEYYYIDKFESGTNKKYGFIAQDVKQIIPESISIHKDYIPNIYDVATVVDNSLIVLDTKTTNEFSISGDILKIKLYDYKNQLKIVTLDKIINTSSFTIKEPLLDSDLSDNKIFVFGQEVNDFHILSKETVFTIATSALQEVDKELEKTKIIVYDISMNMPIYKTRLELAEQKIQEQAITISILQQQVLYLQESINEIHKKINT